MATHTFESEAVEEFYNSCHLKDSGRFCGRAQGKKGAIRVPMSESARRSNAILRRLASDRKSKEYKVARRNMNLPWAEREKGQGGLRNVKGVNSKKADMARAANAKKGAVTRTVGNPNKDKSEPLKGAFKITGNKRVDMINITRLDRGSPERKKAMQTWEKHYGGQ